ncbi:MAG: hypothetical protein ABIT69_00185 [Sphingomicrobium sp.]
MAKVLKRDNKNGAFTVDGRYLRHEASVALRTFVAPLAGVVEAARGGKQAAREKVVNEG